MLGAEKKPEAAGEAARPPSSALLPMWSEDRLAKLRAEYATADVETLREALNAMPGRPIPARQAVYDKARQLSLKRDPEPYAAPPRPDQPAEILAQDEREAEVMVIAGQGARAIAEEFGWPLAQAQAFTARVRARKAA